MDALRRQTTPCTQTKPDLAGRPRLAPPRGPGQSACSARPDTRQICECRTLENCLSFYDFSCSSDFSPPHHTHTHTHKISSQFLLLTDDLREALQPIRAAYTLWTSRYGSYLAVMNHSIGTTPTIRIISIAFRAYVFLRDS